MAQAGCSFLFYVYNIIINTIFYFQNVLDQLCMKYIIPQNIIIFIKNRLSIILPCMLSYSRNSRKSSEMPLLPNIINTIFLFVYLQFFLNRKKPPMPSGIRGGVISRNKTDFIICQKACLGMIRAIPAALPVSRWPESQTVFS